MKVDNLIENDGTEMAVEINFASMKDFGPDSVVQQVEPLRKLAEKREQLMSILAKSEKSRDLENVLKEVLQNADALKSLSDDLGVVSSEESK
jgi:type VI secretion system protein ImpB